MNSRSHALRTGIFIAVFTAAILAATLWISGAHQRRLPYVVVTRGNVFGLRAESTVFYRGIEAGIVKHIAVDAHDPREILISIAVDRSIPITRGTYAQLKLQGVTGMSALELNTTADMRPLMTSAAHPAHIPMRPSFLTRLTRAGTRVARQLTALSTDLGKTLNATNRHHLAAILAHAAQASRQWTALSVRLNRAAARLPAMEAAADTALARMAGVENQVRALGRHLQNLSETAQGAGDMLLIRTLPKVDRALDRLTSAAADVERLSRSLRHHPRELLLGARPLAPGPGEKGYKEAP